MKNKGKSENKVTTETAAGARSIVVSILISGLIIFGTIIFVNYSRGGSAISSGGNVSMVGGQQVVTIKAKGGYQPERSAAKAGLPTVLRVNTRGTFDCSAALRIPSLGIGKILPQNGSTDIELGTPSRGLLQGSCAMGMYPFEIEFE